jgi:ABC-type polysaccharide/polyol phosphate transport system ATPase subunit
MKKIDINNLTVRFDKYKDKNQTIKSKFINLFKPNNSPNTLFTALKNITLSIKENDMVGIIGDNGAGKSTLCKVICGIYEYENNVKINGRIAPLLEIGAGFHPEYSGRENIYLNGAIMGYKEYEIKNIENEIIEFSGLTDFIDTPVKYYSSGMYMRLAFSLATAIKPEILILDEIFASGDQSFQNKARNRVLEFIKTANILVMVSHDLKILSELCNRIIWLENGEVIADGEPIETINKYKQRQIDA